MTRPHDHGDADHCYYCLAGEEAGRAAGLPADELPGPTGASGDDPWSCGSAFGASDRYTAPAPALRARRLVDAADALRDKAALDAEGEMVCYLAAAQVQATLAVAEAVAAR